MENDCPKMNTYDILESKVLQQRMPTRTALRERGVIDPNGNVLCPFCVEEEETIEHLFFRCTFSWKIWTAIYNWIGICMVPHIEPIEHFLQHGEILGGHTNKRIAYSLWVGRIWLIWKIRNDLIFNNINPSVEKAVGEIKARLWSWLSIRKTDWGMSSFQEWSRNFLAGVQT
ncbi:hypothetical protein ACS0TY_024418 [Phlomoides rotata]